MVEVRRVACAQTGVVGGGGGGEKAYRAVVGSGAASPSKTPTHQKARVPNVLLMWPSSLFELGIRSGTCGALKFFI